MSDFDIKNFPGIVHLKDWLQMPDGKAYLAIAGRCSVISDEEMLGFKVGRAESNWLVRVEGGEGGSVNILGCQVRAVSVLPPLQPGAEYVNSNRDFYWVP